MSPDPATPCKPDERLSLVGRLRIHAAVSIGSSRYDVVAGAQLCEEAAREISALRAAKTELLANLRWIWIGTRKGAAVPATRGEIFCRVDECLRNDPPIQDARRALKEPDP